MKARNFMVSRLTPQQMAEANARVGAALQSSARKRRLRALEKVLRQRGMAEGEAKEEAVRILEVAQAAGIVR